MKHMNAFLLYGLQLFAEGGSEGSGDNGSAAGSENNGSQPADVQADRASAGQEGAAAEETFASLIGKGGKYEADYNAAVGKVAQGIRKGTKEMQAKLDAYAPLAEAMAQRYGISDSGNIKAIMDAMDNDTSMLEAEADAKGMRVEDLKVIKQQERELNHYRNQAAIAERNRAAEETYARWQAQAEDAKRYYPGLSFEAELQNEQFVSLLRSGVDVKAAYQVVHMDDIMTAGMQVAAQKTKEAVARSVAAGAKRPTEGANGNAASALTKQDVNSLSRADVREVMNRVMRGERISFG